MKEYFQAEDTKDGLNMRNIEREFFDKPLRKHHESIRSKEIFEKES